MKVNLSVFHFFLTLIIVHAEIDPSWVHPHAWKTSEESKEVAVTTGKPTAPQERAVAIFYLRLLRNIFSRHQMSFDVNSNHYVRNVEFHVTQEQLNILHTTEDVYKLDAVVSQILSASRTSAVTDSLYKVGGFFEAIFLGISGSSPELRFIFATASILSALWYITKKHNYTWWQIFCSSILAMMLFGYIHTYYECNRELEVEELLKLIDVDDPCEEHLKAKERSWFWNIFAKSKKEECADHIKNTHKTKLPFCRPDKVLLLYINDITFHQMETFLTRTGTAFRQSFGNIGILHTAIASFLLICLLSVMFRTGVKYFFKYLMHGLFSDNQQQQQRPATIAVESPPNMLSIENVARLLHISRKLQQNDIAPSGVEMLENLPEKNKDIKKTKQKKTIKDVPGTSNVQADKPLPAEHIADNDIEQETVPENSFSKNDINKEVDTIDSNEQGSSDSEVEIKYLKILQSWASFNDNRKSTSN